ncbi:MAG TPA: class I SAM-dependent methyltransferase [Solirubrobacterales bacterium]|nr:class I SAM-dependent methyltransferase [Solirubrobacterales bacterium]
MPSPPPLTPLAAAVLHVGSPERVLQIECGEGEGALFLSREFPVARVRGIDSSAERVRHAQARAGLDPEGRIAFKQGTPGSTSFPPDHFDLLVAVDARPKVRESARVLRPGGFLVLAGTSRDRAPAGFGARLLRWRLARAGFDPIWEEAAGDGSFSVSRLRGGGPIGASL